jgi:hypothetical protein
MSRAARSLDAAPLLLGTILGAIPVTVCAILPACLAAAHLGNGTDAACDGDVARVLRDGLQPWRALDLAVSSVFALVPVGTLVARAALGGVAALAATALLVYAVARHLLRRCADSPRVNAVVAAIAALGAACAPGFQREATLPGGAVAGGLLGIAPLAVLGFVVSGPLPRDSGPQVGPQDARARLAPKAWAFAFAFALGSALAYDPLVGTCAVVSPAVWLAVDRGTRGQLVELGRSHRRAVLAGAVLGIAPWVLAVARLLSARTPLLPSLVSGWMPVRTGADDAPVAVYAELGTALPVLAIGGAVVALLHPRARPAASALVALVALGAAAAWARSPHGPARFAGVSLAATAALCALAGVALQAIVLWVAGARLPFARASAAMIVLLELALPVAEADESLARDSWPGRARAASSWNDLAFGSLPPRTVIVATDPRLLERARAARAVGELRGDIAVFAASGTGVALEPRALAGDVALVPLRRDLELSGVPSEASLSALAAVRPVAMVYEPLWGRAIARHLVPSVLLDGFAPEPRGASDRARALDELAPLRLRLVRAVTRAGDPPERDPDLVRATAYPLRARCLELASGADRDLIGRVMVDLHAIAPDDPVAAQIVARMAGSRGAPRVDDLRP